MRSKIALAATVFAALASLAPTAMPAANANIAYPCDFHFFKGQPYVDRGAVIAGGWAECADTPDSFELSLTLEYRPKGGNWEVRDANHAEGIPAPHLNAAVASLDCVPGLWRGRAQLWSTLGGKIYSHPVTTPETIISC